MPDPVDDPTALPAPMKILNFRETGMKVVQWAQDPSTRPRDLAEFKQQLAGLVQVPDRFKEIQIMQGYDHVFFLRLPPKNQVTKSHEQLANETDDLNEYGIPDFYFDAINNPDDFKREDFFFSRIADYTIRGCR
ncbi:hypothetical protein [Mesorhizobium sp. IMUNJ 23232]|uniref:hypothetical protein n=1 Tax=Mesorhizobium sp. IMUNJ 23232 TaxID=3376064 RepID=UPI0037B11D74